MGDLHDYIYSHADTLTGKVTARVVFPSEFVLRRSLAWKVPDGLWWWVQDGKVRYQCYAPNDCLHRRGVDDHLLPMAARVEDGKAQRAITENDEV